MKRIQGKNVVGYVTIDVKGENPEFFFQACANEKIPVWDIKKTNKNQCIGNTYVYHLKSVKTIAEKYSYEINVTNSRGYLSYLIRLWTRKEIIISIILCTIIIFVMSNLVWKVNISGVSIDIEKKINKQLTAYGLYEGAWAYSLEALDIIQQDVLHTTPELLYIGIEKKGTTYHVDAVEKLIVDEPEQLSTRHLVATKNGVIQKMFIKKGLPIVQVNDFVNKGDLLVSGIIENQNEKEANEEEVRKEIVAADGEVYANTWYEVTVNSSLHRSHEKLLGEKEIKYYIKVGNFQIPFWGFQRARFEETFIEIDETPIYFLKWEIPVQLIRKNIYNKTSFTQSRTVEEAKDIAIKHVKDDLLMKLGTDVQILKYYVLHETVDSGKVKLDLYVSVLENIASSNPIH